MASRPLPLRTSSMRTTTPSPAYGIRAVAPPLPEDSWSPVMPNSPDVMLDNFSQQQPAHSPTLAQEQADLATYNIGQFHRPTTRAYRARASTQGSDITKNIGDLHSRVASSEYGYADTVAYGSRADLTRAERPPMGMGITVDEKQEYGVAGDGLSRLSARERRWIAGPGLWWRDFLARHRRIAKVVNYVDGPTPPIVETSIKPFFPKIERFFDKLFAPLTARRQVITPLFMLAWLLAFAFLVRASYFDSETNAGTPNWVTADVSYWYTNADCGLNGTSCSPFSDYSYVFRCPGQSLSTELLNDRTIGATEVIYQPLVVGGMDDLHTYRSDSWICAAAIHHGLFGNQRGGCGALELVGEFTDYVGGTKNGVASTSFPSSFISSYRFTDTVTSGSCSDLRNDILGFNVAMLFILSFIIRAAPAPLFWAMFCMGFWHVVLVSDPTSSPPNVSLGFQYFLPAIFVAIAFWRFSFRWVMPAFEGAVMERTVWYCSGFWIGTLINVSLSWIPIDRLTPHDIMQEPGGLVAVICVVIFVFLVVVNQLRVIRRTGWVFHYLFWYIIGGLVTLVLCMLPGLEFRLHHYIVGMILMPGLAFVTRPSAFFQGLLLGMFLDGAGRWGFDTILATPASLVGDGTLGTQIPAFLTSASNFTVGQTDIWWDAIPQDLNTTWDGFSLLVNDVERYAGSATNFSIAGLVDSALPVFLRLAYSKSGNLGDFTMAATAFVANGTWIDAAEGRT